MTLDSWVFDPPDYIEENDQIPSEDSLSVSAISKDGEKIVACSTKIFYLSKESATPIWSYDAQDNENPTTIAISYYGDFFATGSSNGYLLFFNESESSPLWKYLVGYIGDSVNSIDISYDGTYLAVATEVNLFFFETNSSIPKWSYPIRQDIVEITMDGELIITGGKNNLTIFSQSSSTPIWNYSFSSNIIDISVSDTGSSILVGCSNGLVYLFKDFQSFPNWSYSIAGSITDVAISSTGQYFAASDNNDDLYFFTNASSSPLWIYHLKSSWYFGWDYAVPYVSISGNGDFIFFMIHKYFRLFHRSKSNPIWEYEREVQGWGFEEGIPLISYNGDYFATILEGVLYFFYRLNPNQLIDFNNYYIGLLSIGIPIFTIYNGLFFYRFYISRKRRKILKTLANSSDRIRLEMVMNLLNMNEKSFYKKFASLAREHGLKIDEDYLIVDKDKIQEFIDNLLKNFRDWGKKGKID